MVDLLSNLVSWACFSSLVQVRETERRLARVTAASFCKYPPRRRRQPSIRRSPSTSWTSWAWRELIHHADVHYSAQTVEHTYHVTYIHTKHTYRYKYCKRRRLRLPQKTEVPAGNWWTLKMIPLKSSICYGTARNWRSLFVPDEHLQSLLLYRYALNTRTHMRMYACVCAALFSHITAEKWNH